MVVRRFGWLLRGKWRAVEHGIGSLVMKVMMFVGIMEEERKVTELLKVRKAMGTSLSCLGSTNGYGEGR